MRTAPAWTSGPALAALVLCLSAGCVTTGGFIREDGSVDAQALYERRCAQCHALYRPRDFDDEAWAENVRRFAPRAGVRPEWRPALIAWLQQANDRDD